MTRDDEYLRELLLEIEAETTGHYFCVRHLSPSGSELKRWHHVDLLEDQGLVKSTGKGVYRLTSDGHDFIDAIRDEGIWFKTKEAVRDTGGNATLEIIKSLATGFLKKQVAERTGIEL